MHTKHVLTIQRSMDVDHVCMYRHTRPARLSLSRRGFFQRDCMWLWIYIQNCITCAALTLSLPLTVIFCFSPAPRRDATNKLQNKVALKIWLASRANRDTVTDGAPNAIYFLPVACLSFLWQWWSKSSRGKETAMEKSEEEVEVGKRNGVFARVCVLLKYSIGTDLELAAGSQKCWFIHVIFISFSWSLI